MRSRIGLGLLGFASLIVSPSLASDSRSGCMADVSRWTGAYYYKVTSLSGFDGLRAELVLPTFRPDSSRQFDYRMENPKHRAVWAGPLDLADVYFGASHPDTGEEMDSGLAWSVVTDPQGRFILHSPAAALEGRDPATWFRLDEALRELSDPQGSVVARGAHDIDQAIRVRGLRFFHAFTPFYRNNESATAWNAFRDRYYVAGERVQVSLTLDAGTFTLRVTSPGHRDFTARWMQSGFGRSTRGFIFKRIASIDQFNIVNDERRVNEPSAGHPVTVIATTAGVSGMVWETTGVRHPPSGSWEPLHPPGCKEVRPPDLLSRYDQVFKASRVGDLGDQTLEITP